MVTIKVALLGCDAVQSGRGTGDGGSRSVCTYVYHMASHAKNSNLHYFKHKQYTYSWTWWTGTNTLIILSYVQY